MIAQSSDVTAVHGSAGGAGVHAGADALGAVLAQAEAALDAGDSERARRLIAVAKELRALGFGGRDVG
jgi:hypothetical protein